MEVLGILLTSIMAGEDICGSANQSYVGDKQGYLVTGKDKCLGF